MADTRVLVIGAAGMLGHATLQTFATSPGFDVRGTVRSESSAALLPAVLRSRLLTGLDVDDDRKLASVFDEIHPQVAINCVGVVKQLAAADDPLVAIPTNALLPHRLAKHAGRVGARLVHVSTDCVFAGTRGNYRESDLADATDLYGRSKLLGEVDYPHAITLRTSIIGPELAGNHGLIGWFLSQQGQVKGFARAIFSGLPTVVLAAVIRDCILPRPELHGLYHVSAAPISKYDLLRLVAAAYAHDIRIVPDDRLVIDRSLDSSRFREATGWQPPDWQQLVNEMHAAQRKAPK